MKKLLKISLMLSLLFGLYSCSPEEPIVQTNQSFEFPKFSQEYYQDLWKPTSARLSVIHDSQKAE